MGKLLRYLKPYTISIIGIVLLLLAQSIAELFLPSLMSDIVDTGIANNDTAYIFRIGLIMVIAAAGGTICAVLSSLLSARTAVGFSKDIRKDIFTKVENFSLNEFDKIGTSSLITRTTNDVNQMQQVVVMMLRMMVSAPMMLIGGIIMAVLKDPQLSLVIVVIIPLLVLIIFIVAKKGVPLFTKIQEKLDNLNRILRENLTGIRVIRAFNKEDHEKKRFDEASKDLTGTAIHVNKIMAVLMPLMMLIFNLTTVAVIWFGSQRVGSEVMEVGDLMAFVQYITRIMFSLIMMTMIFVMVPRAAVSANRIKEVLDIDPNIKDPKSHEEIDNKNKTLEFRNVSFNYHGAEEPALCHISFSLKKGETTAIIGGTGSGKSTLVNLIPRFYDVTEGEILLGGKDIRKVKQSDLRSHIGFIPQKTVLFNGSISQNIRYGKKDATMEDVRAAAETAQAVEFISTLPEGYDTIVSQGGSNLSGGQKQRLSIARALVRNPDLYIFDDSFSALDFKTDAALRKALKEKMDQAALLIVAQRVSTVMNADQIIVLDEGSISGIGTHNELMQKSEVYREIVASQLSEEELA